MYNPPPRLRNVAEYFRDHANRQDVIFVNRDTPNENSFKVRLNQREVIWCKFGWKFNISVALQRNGRSSGQSVKPWPQANSILQTRPIQPRPGWCTDKIDRKKKYRRNFVRGNAKCPWYQTIYQNDLLSGRATLVFLIRSKYIENLVSRFSITSCPFVKLDCRDFKFLKSHFRILISRSKISSQKRPFQ